MKRTPILLLVILPLVMLISECGRKKAYTGHWVLVPDNRASITQFTVSGDNVMWVDSSGVNHEGKFLSQDASKFLFYRGNMTDPSVSVVSYDEKKMSVKIDGDEPVFTFLLTVP